MTITQIEANITKLLANFSQDSFVFKFLLAYGEPKATITRLQKGDLNQLETKGELTLRKKLLFKEVVAHLHGTIDTLINTYASARQKPRFIIVTDYKTLLAYDTKTTDTLDIDFKKLAEHYDFFLPLAGMEKSIYIDENPADVKASNRLAKLYDEILKSNPTTTHKEVHALNVFLTRLLFCYFAEDSNIFEDNIFTNSIASYTQVDGSDMDSYLLRLFELFNTDYHDRKQDLPEYLKIFPYVNGGLFRDTFPVPKFTTKSRNILIDIGGLDWSQINPDIFGSMIQAVVTPEHRGDMGMHYTSVPNIMKVMQPLFLDELHEEFEKAKDNSKKLNQLHLRLQNLKIFDPACGSGNFLIIAYKELRKLEMLIFKEGGLLISPEIKLTQFYGIELDDFAHEVAILSLWLAEHQMNVAFKKEFGTVPPALPLTDGGNIVHGNATRVDWESVCPKEDGDEIYVLGNPPYYGAKKQNKEQKSDLILLTKDLGLSKNIDYISCWFLKASAYILNFNSKAAFVSTSSISQGEQVPLLWKYIFSQNVEISFCHSPFKWENNAKNNAGVNVVIIGLSNLNATKVKKIINNNYSKEVLNINAYLTSGKTIFIEKENKPINKFPTIYFGSMPRDGGYFILSENEVNDFITEDSRTKEFILKIIGSKEFIRGETRYCIWINEDKVEYAKTIPLLNKRMEQVREWRLESKAQSTQKYADKPYRFVQISYQEKDSLFIPCVSSELRKYIPIGFLKKDTVANNKGFSIYDAEPYLFGVITSLMHMVWVKTVAGRLETRLNYTSSQCYNAFPFPDISKKQKEKITDLVFNILDEREQHSEKILAQLYDPDKMPQGLKEAHHQLDLAIEQCYRKKPFKSDEERLEYLFKLYEEMIKAEDR